MKTPRLHTRFVFTPTGPAHLGHAYLARLNKELAVQTGGTFVYRFENVSASSSMACWRDDRLAQSEANLKEMTAIGLGPSSPETLREQGFDPGIGYIYQSDSGIARHYYKLWGLEKFFGSWPPPYPEGAYCNSEAIYLDDRSDHHSEHPYVILERAAQDVQTGRNLVLRGEDLIRELCSYSMFSTMILRDHRERLPQQWYLPLIKRENKGELVTLSSSNADLTGNMYIQDFLAARPDDNGVGEELFAFLDAYTTKEPWPPKSLRQITTVKANLVSNPVVPQKEWDKFLAGKWRSSR